MVSGACQLTMLADPCLCFVLKCQHASHSQLAWHSWQLRAASRLCGCCRIGLLPPAPMLHLFPSALLHGVVHIRMRPMGIVVQVGGTSLESALHPTVRLVPLWRAHKCLGTCACVGGQCMCTVMPLVVGCFYIFSAVFHSIKSVCVRSVAHVCIMAHGHHLFGA